MKNFETNEDIIYGLIIEEIDQAISPEDKQVVDQWRQISPVNEKTYQDLLNVQANIDKLYKRMEIDPQQSWDNLNKKMDGVESHTEQEEVPVVKLKKSNNLMWIRIAASLVFILSISYYFVRESNFVVITTDEHASITNMVLPDGTQMKLNAATTIRYNKNNFLKDRKLELLKGEAFIHVTQHNGPQFRVDLGDVETIDIGTSFNVFKNDKKVTVVVEEGKVALTQSSTHKQVVLTSGKMGLYNPETKELMAMDNIDPNYKAWIDKSFVFNEIPFRDAAVQMENAYQTQIIIKGEELKNRKFTGRLKYQTVDSALQVISASLQCKISKDKDTYVLYDH